MYELALPSVRWTDNPSSSQDARDGLTGETCICAAMSLSVLHCRDVYADIFCALPQVEMVKEKNQENPVIVYSKTWCPYCSQVGGQQLH